MKSQQNSTSDTPARNGAQSAGSHLIRRYLFTKKAAYVGSAVIVIVVAGILVYRYHTRNNPDYRTILPDNKSVSELGGWKRVSPPGKDPVFAYSDNINNIPITVSQQPLPNSFKTETANHVAELAKAYNATTKINVGDTVVYIGTSSKGPQSVIFTQKNLLILIKSQKVIDNGAWGEYVKSLGGDSNNRTPKY